jgi:hypothetical protein
MSDNPSDDEAIANVIGYFAERVNLVFSYFYCTLEFEADEDFTANPSNNGRAWALQTIQSACLHSTLIALRDLDDVLTPRALRSKPDDLKISDFGFPDTLKFLADSERDAINKRIAHSTVPGTELMSDRWDVFELATKAVRQSLTFLEWAEKHLDWSTAIFCHSRIQRTYDYFARAVEERRKS